MENKPNGAVHLQSTVARCSLIVNHSGIDENGHPYANPFTEEGFREMAEQSLARLANQHPDATFGDMVVTSEVGDEQTVWTAACLVRWLT